MKARFSPLVFMTAYCGVYVLLLASDLPLFRYYPFHGDVTWGWTSLKAAGPAVAWYGLVSGAAIPALFAAVLIGDRPLQRRVAVWSIPILCMIASVFLMQSFFLR